MVNANGEIKLYGALRSKTQEHKTAFAAEIYDEAQGKFQSQINQETAQEVVYDVSEKNPTGGPNSDGKFTLEYILDSNNVNTLIPTSVRKGGMSIKFVHTSDNKYVQARCMAQNFTTDTTQWQGIDAEPTAGSKNLVDSNGVFSAVNEVLFQSEIIDSSNFDILPVSIQENEKFAVMVNTQGTFTRLILVYNDAITKRLIDSDTAGDFANQRMVFAAKENITSLGLYITGDCKASISILKYPSLSDKFGDSEKWLSDMFTGDNLLQRKDTKCYHNAVYNGGHSANYSYTYFIVPVISGHTYNIYPKIRFLFKKDESISGESTGSVSYTADYTGDLYITFFNSDENYIVTEKNAFKGIAGYDSSVRTFIKDKRGLSNLYPISQIGVRDAISEYIYGPSSNLICDGEFVDNAFYQGGNNPSQNYIYFKVSLEANVEYFVSSCLRFICTTSETIAAFPNLTDSFITFIPQVNGDYYFSFNKVSNVEGYFIGRKDGFKAPNILFGKKWVSCGDSFTQGAFDGAPAGSYKFIDMPYEGKNKVYPFFIGRRCGMNVVNEAISGSTMAYVDGNRSEFSTPNGRYTQIPDDADYITLWFGINDSHQNVPIGTISDNVNTTFYGAWNIVMSYLIEHHPNAKIGIIITNGCDTTAYPIAIRNIAKKWGVSYLDINGDYKVPLMLRTNEKTDVDASVLQSILERQSVDYPDNQHPNVEAHEYQSTFIENWLKSL